MSWQIVDYFPRRNRSCWNVIVSPTATQEGKKMFTRRKIAVHVKYFILKIFNILTYQYIFTGQNFHFSRLKTMFSCNLLLFGVSMMEVNYKYRYCICTVCFLFYITNHQYLIMFRKLAIHVLTQMDCDRRKISHKVYPWKFKTIS